MNKLLLVSDCPLDQFQLREYNSFLTNLNIKVDHHKFSNYLQQEEKLDFLAKKMAEIRINDFNKKNSSEFIFPAEIEYEKNHINNEASPSNCFYDGFEFQYLLRKYLFEFAFKNNIFVILITDKKLMTWENDNRYHLRAVILGFPSIISRRGVIEAPAKAREYYILKNFAASSELEKWLSENKKNYLTLEDARLKEVIKGYLLQCLYYWRNLEIDFCSNINCSLYNSHWQEEVLKSQLNHKLCNAHWKKLLSNSNNLDMMKL